jgi:hypothetical protein
MHNYQIYQNIKIVSPSNGQAIPIGNLTISGTSSDNPTTNCQVYADWNDQTPYHKVVANGPGGANDYSKWTFKYSNTYHPITNGTNKLTAKLSCSDNSGLLAKWSSINVIGTPPAAAVASSQSTSDTTKILMASLQGQQNSTEKLQGTIFRALHVQIPTISQIKKSSIRIPEQQQQQQKQGITPQQLQNGLKTFLNNLSPKQKSTLTQPQKDLLTTMPNLIQKGLSPYQTTQVSSLLEQLTKGTIGSSYNIFNPTGGAVGLGIKLASLADSGKLKTADILLGLGAIYLSSHTGLSPYVLYESGKHLLSPSPSPTKTSSLSSPPPTTYVPTINKGSNKDEKVEPNTQFTTAADKAQIDASRDSQGLNDHGYDSSCPSGHSSEFCGNYKQAYDERWNELHPSKDVELEGYHCTNEGCGWYEDGLCKTCGKSTTPTEVPAGQPIPFIPSSAPEEPNTESPVSAVDKAQIDASRDSQGLNDHGYDSSCPSGHSSEFCGNYKQAYDERWNELHSSVSTIQQSHQTVLPSQESAAETPPTTDTTPPPPSAAETPPTTDTTPPPPSAAETPPTTDTTPPPPSAAPDQGGGDNTSDSNGGDDDS